MSSDATLPIQPGALVCGRFAVDEVLGVGGMGAVYAARDVATEARVAIKCMLPEFATNAEVVTRFIREARATSRLRSEHVAGLRLGRAAERRAVHRDGAPRGL